MAKQPTPEKLSYDCLLFEQGRRKLVLFSCSAKELWTIVQVNQHEEDGEDGYQRGVSTSRLAKIAAFIDDGNYIPTSVLISFEHAKLSADGTKLIVDKRQDAGWVIDGQHRLAGANQSEQDIVLPVVAFTDLDINDQINCFVTINREQRGVSSSLYLELLKHLPGTRNLTDDAKQRAVDLAHQLRQDEDSPFFGRIVSTTSPKRGELSLTNFVRKVHPLLKQGGQGGRLATFNDEHRCSTLNNYYKGLQQVFPDEYDNSNSVFFKTAGFGALIGVLTPVLDITLTESKKFRVVDVAKTLKRISDFDFSGWRKFSGSGAESNLTKELWVALTKQSGKQPSSLIEFE